MTSLTRTEIEELRACIAEEMGWRCNYTTSINSIQAACLERFKKPLDVIEFQVALSEKNKGTPTYDWQLTALDWCIAFARTAKIWRYKV